MRRIRTRAERDATTVEIVFAAVTGGGLAVFGFLLLAVPVMAGQAHGTARKGWFTAAVIVAAAVFCVRVAVTLRRFEQQNRDRERVLMPGQRDGSHDDDGEAAVREPGEGLGPEFEAEFGPEFRADAEPRSRTSTDPAVADDGRTTPGQPSQPGRTRPDS